MLFVGHINNMISCRRRGKNTQAAQKCRLKKMEELARYEGQIGEAQEEQEHLLGQRRWLVQVKEVQERLLAEMIRRLRADTGQEAVCQEHGTFAPSCVANTTCTLGFVRC